MQDPSHIGNIDDPKLLVFPLHLLDRASNYYCVACSSLDQDDPELALQIARELLDYVAGETHRILTSLPVGNLIVPDEPVTVGPVTFRTLTPEEAAARHSQLSRAHDSLPGSRFRPLPETWINERCVIEIRSRVPKLNPPRADEKGRSLVLALELAGFRVTGAGHSLAWEEPEWIGFGGRLSSPVDLPSRATSEPKALTDESLREVLTLQERLPPDDALARPPEQHEHVTLRRFMLGAARRSNADSIVDHATALEGVLLPPTGDNRELRYRFSLHGAVFIADDPSERQKLQKSMTSLYDLRSRLVHGGTSHPTHEELTEGVEIAYKLSRRALRKAVERGWPDQTTFYDLLLGQN